MSSTTGASSSALFRAEVSAAAEAMMASAAAWSAEDGAGAPMVCQLFFFVLRNSALVEVTRSFLVTEVKGVDMEATDRSVERLHRRPLSFWVPIPEHHRL